MPITLGINISSLQAQRRLSDATSSTSKLFEQLSSGLRINSASDDSAGLAVSEDLNLHTRVYTKAILNGSDAQSILSIADTTLNQLGSITSRIRELATQSANGTFGVSQRESLDTEAQALAREFFRISRSASFNGINLFDGTLSDGIRFQLGFGTDGGIKSTLGGSLGTGTITSKTTYTAESTSSNGVALGDLNGDGVLDMVTAGASGPAGFATIRLGNSDGTFGASTSYNSETTSSAAVTLGDLNNDGILDLVTAGTSGASGAANVRLGNGNGTFGSATSYAADTSSTNTVKLGDFNGDGILDMVTGGTTGAGGTSTIRLGVGDGTFGALNSVSHGVQAIDEVSLGDLNNDGFLDIVTIDTNRSGYASVRLGNGNGTFGTTTSFDTGLFGGWGGVSLGDLNGDGILDLVSGGVGGGVGRTVVQLGKGNGTFDAATSYLSEGSFTMDVTLADMNGDGNLDMISAGYLGADGYTTIRLGNGNGTFGSATSYLSDSNRSYGVVTGDINGDGVIDVITAGVTDGAAGSTTTFLGGARDGISPLLPFTLTTKADSMQAMSMLEKTMNNLSTQRGVVGAFQSRLGIAINNLLAARENFTAARSRITDVDVASATADLVRSQILQKSATAILAQANQSPKLALQLLQN